MGSRGSEGTVCVCVCGRGVGVDVSESYVLMRTHICTSVYGLGTSCALPSYTPLATRISPTVHTRAHTQHLPSCPAAHRLRLHRRSAAPPPPHPAPPHHTGPIIHRLAWKKFRNVWLDVTWGWLRRVSMNAWSCCCRCLMNDGRRRPKIFLGGMSGSAICGRSPWSLRCSLSNMLKRRWMTHVRPRNDTSILYSVCPNTSMLSMIIIWTAAMASVVRWGARGRKAGCF